MAEALYRKYRPQIFEDVVGQEQIERTIKNAIEQDKVSHAYLFCGPRGTGKTTTARLLAKALLCEKGPTPDPDGTCEDCQMIAEGVHPDVYELDAASRTGVENVREEIINRVQFAPTRGRYKVYIIDEVHMLSIAAFNALLKTLEEPPDHVVFILATTDPQKVPETIHSRCQRFDFRRISNESIVSRLGAVCVAEGVEFEGDALDLIAHHAGGGMRNALTSLEQTIAFGEGKVTLAVAERMLGGVDTPNAVSIYPTDFNTKEEVISYLEGWNTLARQELQAYKDAHGGSADGYAGKTEVTYTDTVGMLMGMVQTILDAITYVLVAFTGISLVVSTVMIGVITYVSVVERTKEIGILRAIGARKKDIKHVFNAETFIIGLCSGLFGVAVAYILQVIINLILTPLTGIAGLASLQWYSALVMVVISVLLTLISGLFPASAAAKRDPVVALRTE